MNQIRFEISVMLKKYHFDLFGSVILIHYFVNEFFSTQYTRNEIKVEVGNMIALQYNYDEIIEIIEDFELKETI